MKKFIFVLCVSFLSHSIFAQKESGDVKDGNDLYKSKKYTEAEIAYRKGLLKNPKSFEANYNLGNALFKQSKYPEALEQYTKSLATEPKDKGRVAAAFHNTGNALFADKKYEESIKAYKMALKNNPKDNDTRYNLAYAQEMLKKQEEQKQKNKTPEDKEADKIKKLADELVSKRMYQEAYNLMKEGEKKNKRLLQYADFTNRILNIVKLK
jgi:tetratricopeptide (TPR) repeat protein